MDDRERVVFVPDLRTLTGAFDVLPERFDVLPEQLARVQLLLPRLVGHMCEAGAVQRCEGLDEVRGLMDRHRSRSVALRCRPYVVPNGYSRRRIVEMAGTPGSDDAEPRRSAGARRPVLTRHDVLVAALRLLDGVVELVLSELEIPSRQAGDWDDVLRRTARRFRQIALAHPHVVPLLVTRPLATPLALRPIGTLRPLEALLDLLANVGFSPRGALHAYRL